MVSNAIRSGVVKAFTTPELEKALPASLPALDAQSPASPPEAVLKALREVVPLSAEK